MNRALIAALGAGLVSLVGSVAHASEPRTHDGFFFQGAIGGGYLGADLKLDDVDYATLSGGAVSGGLLFGGTPAPGLVIGGGTANSVALGPKLELEEGGELDSDSDVSLNLSTLGIFGAYYPDPHGGLSLQLMLALAVLTVANDDTNYEADATGGAITAGVGYDFWVAPEWSIGVLGRFTYASVKDSDDPSDAKLSVMAPSLLATFTHH